MSATNYEYSDRIVSMFMLRCTHVTDDFILSAFDNVKLLSPKEKSKMEKEIQIKPSSIRSLRNVSLKFFFFIATMKFVVLSNW